MTTRTHAELKNRAGASPAKWQPGLLAIVAAAIVVAVALTCGGENHPLAPVTAVAGVGDRLAAAEDPPFTTLSFRLRAIADTEVRLVGRVMDPSVKYDTLHFFEPNGAICASAPWQAVCNGDHDSFTGDADLTFNVVLDAASTAAIDKALIGANLKAAAGDSLIRIIHAEVVAYARWRRPFVIHPVFPGWRESADGMNISFKGAPFWIDSVHAEANWHQMQTCPKVTLSGALVIDDAHRPWGVEVHPVSKIDVDSLGSC